MLDKELKDLGYDMIIYPDKTTCNHGFFYEGNIIDIMYKDEKIAKIINLIINDTYMDEVYNFIKQHRRNLLLENILK